MDEEVEWEAADVEEEGREQGSFEGDGSGLQAYEAYDRKDTSHAFPPNDDDFM